MKNINYYSVLPDGMTEAELNSEFLELIRCFECSECTVETFLVALSELGARQWHTYTLLSDDLRREIDALLISCWDGHDLESAEIIICVAAQLGLEGVFGYVCSQKGDDLSPEVASEIKSAMSEFGGAIGDPFSGMK